MTTDKKLPESAIQRPAGEQATVVDKQPPAPLLAVNAAVPAPTVPALVATQLPLHVTVARADEPARPSRQTDAGNRASTESPRQRISVTRPKTSDVPTPATATGPSPKAEPQAAPFVGASPVAHSPPRQVVQTPVIRDDARPPMFHAGRAEDGVRPTSSPAPSPQRPARASAPSAQIFAPAAGPAQASPLDLPGPGVAPCTPVASVKRSIGTPDGGDKGQMRARSLSPAPDSPLAAKAVSHAAQSLRQESDSDKAEVRTDSDEPERATRIDAQPAPAILAATPIIVPMTAAAAAPAAERTITFASTAAVSRETATPGITVAAAVAPPGPGHQAGFTLAHHAGEQPAAPKSHAAASRSAAHPGSDDKLAAVRPDQAALAWFADALQASRPASATDVNAPPAAAQISSPPPPALQTFTLAELAPPPPPVAMPLWTQAADDPSLRATLMPETAHLSMDTGGAGELSLHLRIKDGIADVRVDGMASATLDIRQQDLRAALASEGLTLGTFESGQQPAPQHGGNVDGRDDAPTSGFAPRGGASNPTGATPAAKDSQPARSNDGRVHVTA
jgi:hypothetical protein